MRRHNEVIEKALSALTPKERTQIKVVGKASQILQSVEPKQFFVLPYEGVRKFTRPLDHPNVRHNYRTISKD